MSSNNHWISYTQELDRYLNHRLNFKNELTLPLLTDSDGVSFTRARTESRTFDADYINKTLRITYLVRYCPKCHNSHVYRQVKFHPTKNAFEPVIVCHACNHHFVIHIDEL